MKSFTIGASAAFATLAFATTSQKSIHVFVDPATNQTVRHFDCDVHQGMASAHFNETLALLHDGSRHTKQVGSRAASLLAEKRIGASIRVTTYIHLITTAAKAGTLTVALANTQLAVLNKAYNPIGVYFTLGNVTIDANDAWAVADGADMDALKRARRYGTYSDLNLYFHTDLSGGILGTCTLPSQVTAQTQPSQYYSDGCNIDADTMPSGAMDGYNLGLTAVHETGHWLGLLHTFEGYACTGNGDFISDTPIQSTSTDGCPMKPAKDSCPRNPGVDAIHNYMDYSYDSCYTNFTPGQASRISSLWAMYRKGF